MVDFIHFLDHIYLLSIAAHLLTHFVRSLVRLALPSVTQLLSVAELPSVAFCARAYRSLTLFASLYAHFTHSLRSFASFAHRSLTSFVRSLCSLHSRLSLATLAMCFEIVHNKFHKLVLHPTILYFASLYTISWAEADCRMTPFACTITFYYSFVQSLCTKKFFHKIVKCAGTPMSYTTHFTTFSATGRGFYPTPQKTMLKLFDWFKIWYA